MLESGIAQRIILRMNKNPMVLTIRRNVGLFYTKNGTPISIGVTGEADWQGIIGGQLCPHCSGKIHPLPFCLETKTLKGKQREEQVKFQEETWERRGGIYVLANNPVIDYTKVIQEKAMMSSLDLL